MPITMRPSERSCSVAYELASTVGSRVAGFVTKWPSLIFDVSRAATASIGIDSCQSTCESYVHAYSKPCVSASWISSSQREIRRIGQDGDAEAEHRASLAREPIAASRARPERRATPSDDEADPAVAGQREREADERRAGDDRRATAQALTKPTAAPGASGRAAAAPGERRRERDAGGESEDRCGEHEQRHSGSGQREHERRRRPPTTRLPATQSRRVRPAAASAPPATRVKKPSKSVSEPASAAARSNRPGARAASRPSSRRSTLKPNDIAWIAARR